ncbi:hypothetical protein CIHG_07355 [Coccidioides immitis H538.4]|uniref:Uncharacterized protein n=1 Tax=Coccidioides immitis H538.4 TaxID=396776 RepID=A0A0J8UPU4_COCIT|nr:hypothetical protein CIHG_07355 [Coccidioides immitis H538.4]
MPLEELDQTQPSRETAWFGSCNVVKGRLIETVLKFKSPWNPPCFDSLWMISYFQYHGLPEDYQPTDPRVACATDHFYFIFFNLVSRVARNLITGAFRHPSRYDDKSDTAAVSSVPEPVIWSGALPVPFCVEKFLSCHRCTHFLMADQKGSMETRGRVRLSCSSAIRNSLDVSDSRDRIYGKDQRRFPRIQIHLQAGKYSVWS